MSNKLIIVTSGYGGNTRRPFVQIESEELDRPLQISPEEARQLALNLLQASEAADQDEFLVRFSQDRLGLDIKDAAVILSLYREFRSERNSNAPKKNST
jgi:hypothetical protein